jgi:hypothetical protein
MDSIESSILLNNRAVCVCVCVCANDSPTNDTLHDTLQAVTACQSDGLSLCTQLVQSQLFDNDKCNHCASSILAQNSFIRKVLRRLEPNLRDNNMSSSVQSVSSSSSDLSSSEGEVFAYPYINVV